jgi:hypothetical protein
MYFKLNVRVNSTEYASGIVIERIYEDGSSNVPAWEELSLSEFVGPFDSINEAEIAIKNVMEVVS